MPINIILELMDTDSESASIGTWHKVEGDHIEKGEIIVDIETDKAVVELEAKNSGILSKILFDTGSTDVPMGTAIGLLSGDSETFEDPKLTPNHQHKQVFTKSSETAFLVLNNSSNHVDVSSNEKERLFASPLARRVAKELNVDISHIKGRGPNNRILKKDVEQAAHSGKTASALPAAENKKIIVQVAANQNHISIPNSSIRRVIAERLCAAKQNIPHFYLKVDIEMNELLELREDLNDLSTKDGRSHKISINDIIVFACSLALEDVPQINSSWTDEAILQYQDINISIAVSTPRGLITPVVKNVNKKKLSDVSMEIKELASRAHAGALRPEEYQGGGFTISNLGMFGIKSFNAIINPPQSCILAIGACQQTPVAKEGEIVIRTIMNATLSVDHRAVDGAPASEFLQRLKHYIEDPMLLLLR